MYDRKISEPFEYDPILNDERRSEIMDEQLLEFAKMLLADGAIKVIKVSGLPPTNYQVCTFYIDVINKES